MSKIFSDLKLNFSIESVRVRRQRDREGGPEVGQRARQGHEHPDRRDLHQQQEQQRTQSKLRDRRHRQRLGWNRNRVGRARDRFRKPCHREMPVRAVVIRSRGPNFGHRYAGKLQFGQFERLELGEERPVLSRPSADVLVVNVGPMWEEFREDAGEFWRQRGQQLRHRTELTSLEQWRGNLRDRNFGLKRHRRLSTKLPTFSRAFSIRDS